MTKVLHFLKMKLCTLQVDVYGEFQAFIKHCQVSYRLADANGISETLSDKYDGCANVSNVIRPYADINY